MKNASAALAALAACLLAACASAPSPAPSAALTTATPEAMVAVIRAAAGKDDSELAVQPLRDPMVEDLRHDAQRLETGHHYAEAAATLDRALALVPEDPALLQERAEAAPAASPASRRVCSIVAQWRRHSGPTWAPIV